MKSNQWHSDELNQKMLARLGYEIRPRTFTQMRKFFSLDYNRNQFNYKDYEVIYSGAEHSGTPKLPNLTILPHLETRNKFIAGSTFGHTHIENDEREFQEIYEFCGYGGMLIYDPQHTNLGVTLRVLKPGEKVTISPRENMTLLNLDNKDLVTLDYANPSKNRAHKDLENLLGTLLTIEQEASYGSVTFYTSESRTTFRINPQYVERGILHSKELSATFFDASLGEELYRALQEHGEERLGKMGIKLSFGGNAMQFPEPLMQYALRQDKKLLSALGFQCSKENNGGEDHEPI